MRVTDKPILLVEDDKVDAIAVIRALKEANVENQIVHVENGEEALNYLHDSTSHKPCIILLDLNMPIMNGIEFLEALRNDERLRRIPVVILTTSDDPEDKLRSFNLGIAGYMPKPLGYVQFVNVMKAIDAYWTLSEMP
jgi:CheY-like chemotaxis protein